MISALGPMLLVISASPFMSTAAMWTGGNSLARAACIKAAGLTGATASSLVIFSDEGGAKTAVLINGRYRQSFMHNRPGTMLCLYDRRTKRAEVQEAKGWSAPR